MHGLSPPRAGAVASMVLITSAMLALDSLARAVERVEPLPEPEEAPQADQCGISSSSSPK